jgi:hypothetical protein
MNSCRWQYEPLVAALRMRGIRFLAPSDARPGPDPINDRDLIVCLASHDHPRLDDETRDEASSEETVEPAAGP